MLRAMLVDDEQRVLDALRRQLRPLRREWGFVFESDSLIAVQRLQLQTFDVIVTDMRMPELDGATLLEAAREYQPEALRYVLSGQAEREQSLSVALSAHQYHSKPCKTTEIRDALEKAGNIKRTLSRSIYQQLVDNSPPRTIAALLDCLAAEDVNLEHIGALIQQDLAMSLKSLKWVCTPFFGKPLLNARVEESPSILGAGLLRSLVESGAYCREARDGESVEQLNATFRQRQGIRDAWDLVGELALRGLQRHEYESPATDFHDVGVSLASLWGIPLQPVGCG